MRVIIAGGRDLLRSSQKIQEYVDASGFEITELVCGMARGIDRCGKRWAEELGITVIPFTYDDYREEAIQKYGTDKMAGHIRNGHMADYAQALILIWDGLSSGSSSMYEESLKRGLPIFEVIINKKNR